MLPGKSFNRTTPKGEWLSRGCCLTGRHNSDNHYCKEHKLSQNFVLQTFLLQGFKNECNQAQSSYWQGRLYSVKNTRQWMVPVASVRNLRSKWESKDCPFLVFYIPVPLFHRLFSYGYVRNRFLLPSTVVQSHTEVWSPQTAMFALYCFKHENNFPYREILIIWKTYINSNESFKTIINVIFFPWIWFSIPIS